jgi:filamentous hemagglutinin
MLSVGRALMTACAGGPLAPGCVAATTELALGATSEYTGVSTVGMTAAGTTAMASRLAKSASSATDVAAVVREARAVVGEAKAIESARLLNNFYREGAPPDLIQKTYNAAAVNSTHNTSASEVILGRYIAGSADTYDEVAKARGATYFSMSDWNSVQGQLGKENMWEINKAFLDQQIAQSKRLLFTQDPRLADPKSYTYKEFEHLMSSGYKIVKEGSLYVASKR